MKKYELLSLIKSNIDIDSIEQIIQNLESQIKSFGGNVLNTDKIGRKRLAYEISNSRDGFYVAQHIELSGDKIKDLKNYLKLNENIVRSLVTVLPKEAAKV